MKAANNMAELEQMIMAEMQKAVQEVYSKSKADAESEVKSFYSQGSPLRYVRTGKLGRSVRASNVGKAGRRVTFSLWLDTTMDYLVPNPAFTERGYASYFSTPAIFEAAENHTAHILGKPGFWKRSTKKIEKNIDSVFSRYFNK